MGCDSCGPIAQFAFDVLQEIPDCAFRIVRCKRTASKEACLLRLLQGFDLFLFFGVERLAQVDGPVRRNRLEPGRAGV